VPETVGNKHRVYADFACDVHFFQQLFPESSHEFKVTCSWWVWKCAALPKEQGYSTEVKPPTTKTREDPIGANSALMLLSSCSQRMTIVEDKKSYELSHREKRKDLFNLNRER